MEIYKISNISKLGEKRYENASISSFAEILKEAFEKVNNYQNDYSALVQRQIQGEEINLHDLMIAGQKAQLTLELTLQIRNKAVEAYQEIMRMQV